MYAVAAQLNIDAVGMLRGSSNAALVDELARVFDRTADDQADALSVAFSKLTQCAPIRVSEMRCLRHDRSRPPSFDSTNRSMVVRRSPATA